MASREYLWLVQESSFGVPATPTTGTNAWYIRLDGSNAFSMTSDPIIQNVMYGGGRNTPAFGVADQFESKGALKTKLYAGAFGKFLLDWGLTPINTGRTAPWTTTDSSALMPVGDLPSVSCYHAIELNDGTYDLRLHNGVKVTGGTISTSRSSPIAEITLNLQGIRDDLDAAGTLAYPDATEFPAPAEANYPSNPYLFSHTSANLKIAATVTQYDSLQFSWTNSMDPKWFESKYVLMNRFLGRSSTLQVAAHLKASPNRRTAFQALTLQDTEFAFDNGVYKLKVDMNTANLISKLPYDLPIDKVYEQSITVQNYWDAAVPGDIVVTGAAD